MDPGSLGRQPEHDCAERQFRCQHGMIILVPHVHCKTAFSGTGKHVQGKLSQASGSDLARGADIDKFDTSSLTNLSSSRVSKKYTGMSASIRRSGLTNFLAAAKALAIFDVDHGGPLSVSSC
jgi:hypothetical protein